MNNTRRRPEQIRKLLAEFTDSGSTQREFAHRHGVCTGTIQYWIRHYGLVESPRSPRLVEVQPIDPPPDGASCRVELRGGVSINYEHRPEPSYLVELVRQLQTS